MILIVDFLSQVATLATILILATLYGLFVFLRPDTIGIKMSIFSSARDSSLSKELTRVMKDVDKDLKEARKAVAKLNELHAKLKPRKINASMGHVPMTIYTKKAAAQTDILYRLPFEIQRMIWSYLIHQPDRMALALTCKWNAELQDQFQSRYNEIAIRAPQKAHRLAVLIRLSTWVPYGFQVCFECARFCKRYNTSDWGGDTAMVKEQHARAGRVTKDAMTRGPRCPRCKYITGFQQLNHKATVKEYKNLLKKHCGSVD